MFQQRLRTLVKTYSLAAFTKHWAGLAGRAWLAGLRKYNKIRKTHKCKTFGFFDRPNWVHGAVQVHSAWKVSTCTFLSSVKHKFLQQTLSLHIIDKCQPNEKMHRPPEPTTKKRQKQMGRPTVHWKRVNLRRKHMRKRWTCSQDCHQKTCYFK